LILRPAHKRGFKKNAVSRPWRRAGAQALRTHTPHTHTHTDYHTHITHIREYLTKNQFLESVSLHCVIYMQTTLYSCEFTCISRESTRALASRPCVTCMHIILSPSLLGCPFAEPRSRKTPRFRLARTCLCLSRAALARSPSGRPRRAPRSRGNLHHCRPHSARRVLRCKQVKVKQVYREGACCPDSNPTRFTPAANTHPAQSRNARAALQLRQTEKTEKDGGSRKMEVRRKVILHFARQEMAGAL
jgi:hypothetical protein